MKASAREMRRAPVRVVASILAIALAIAAIGIFGVPGVARSSLRDVAAQDNLSHITIRTTSVLHDPASVVAEIMAVDGIENVEVRTIATMELADRSQVRVVGSPAGNEIDTIRILDGRDIDGGPATSDSRPTEVVAGPGLGEVGDEVEFPGTGHAVIVGVGQTTYWADVDALYTSIENAQRLTGVDGANGLVVRLDDPSSENLHLAVADLRQVLRDHDAAVAAYLVIPDGHHPIEQEIEQVSFMIGSLGVVAGIVALVLLASTANAIVTERTRDAAVMRALGGTRRAVRSDLRRPAITIGVIGTLVGLPLGVGVANLIARMVLERFAGITPAIGVDLGTLAASAAFGVVGARVVAGRVARKAANAELVTALRDRDGVPYGARWSHRVLARLPLGGLSQRIALRSIARRKGRGLSVAAQFAGAIGAAVLVASLITSTASFNELELASFEWRTTTAPADPVYPYPLDIELEEGAELALHEWVTLDGYGIEVYGVDPRTSMIDRQVTAGRWLGGADSAREVVLAERLATQEGHRIGDTITIELPTGPAEYELIGLHPVRSVAAFVPLPTLAADLGATGRANTVWTDGTAETPAVSNVATQTWSRQVKLDQDKAGRDAILAIFVAIGAIVVTIATLGAASTVAMNLHERRGELAAFQAVGGRRRDVKRLIMRELGLLAVVGWLVGSLAGWLGAKAIMGFFSTANAIELGFVTAWLALPITALAGAALVWLLAATAARQSQRRPLAATLRAAT